MLVVGGKRVPLELTVPAGSVTVEQVLPILAASAGCLPNPERPVRRPRAAKFLPRRLRRLLPPARPAPSPSEARALARLVDAMPVPRRTVIIHQRFDAASRCLGDLVDRRPRGTAKERVEFSHAYFKLGIACPFLEDEACSTHPDRPMACREHLVSSPPENCRTPRPDNADKLALDAYMLPTLVEAGGRTRLLLALRFRAENPEPAPSREAPAILRERVGRLVTELPPRSATGHARSALGDGADIAARASTLQLHLLLLPIRPLAGRASVSG
ncbi:YkgJ family cysteine cluster protein [Reyranella sp.]|uniref:YkgJ family cysteine cluster protein n=1 Tax=Reyranella sp. TaxID=1929291 RepID=UPI003D0E31B6